MFLILLLLMVMMMTMMTNMTIHRHDCANIHSIFHLQAVAAFAAEAAAAGLLVLSVSSVPPTALLNAFCNVFVTFEQVPYLSDANGMSDRPCVQCCGRIFEGVQGLGFGVLYFTCEA
jgi:hypothetical protein